MAIKFKFNSHYKEPGIKSELNYLSPFYLQIELGFMKMRLGNASAPKTVSTSYEGGNFAPTLNISFINNREQLRKQ